jgi:hypothetical protein
LLLPPFELHPLQSLKFMIALEASLLALLPVQRLGDCFSTAQHLNPVLARFGHSWTEKLRRASWERNRRTCSNRTLKRRAEPFVLF